MDNINFTTTVGTQRFPNCLPVGMCCVFGACMLRTCAVPSMQIVIWRVNQTDTGKNVENELASEELKRNASATYTVVHAHMAK